MNSGACSLCAYKSIKKERWASKILIKSNKEMIMSKEESKQYLNDLLAKYQTVTKASHYVKREYLSNWSPDGKKIYTSMNNGEYHFCGLKSVCTETYMYQLETLSDFEMMQIRRFYRGSPEAVKQANENFILGWQIACLVSENIDSPELKELAKKMKIQVGEDIQTNFESGFIDEVKSDLLNCSEDFLSNDDYLLSFSFFLFSQFLRTQKQRNKIISSFESDTQVPLPKEIFDPKRIWNPLITVMTNMAAFRMLCQTNLHIKFIKSNSRLIKTCDQPILNIADDIDKDYVKFYYPINPSVAIIFPADSYEIVEDDDFLIDKYNKLIEKESNRFVFKYHSK